MANNGLISSGFVTPAEFPYDEPYNNELGSWVMGQTASIPGGTGTYSIAIAVWANLGNASETLAQAQAAGYAWGFSDIVKATLATSSASAGYLPFGTGANQLSSFSLIEIPEPASIALGVMGLSALLFRRRQ
jgi:hypothetical protein